MKDKIFEKLMEHDKKFIEHDKRFDKIEKRFDKTDEKFDVITKKLLEHDNYFDEMREEFNQKFNQVLTSLDKVMVIVQRLDQERLFTFEIIKRMQKDIDNNQKDLNRVKQILKIA